MINKVERERVSNNSFGGLVVDSQLNWGKQLAHTYLKVSKIIGILHRL